MLRDRNGQIQMTETIAVLFIFFILVFFGLIFYYKYVDSSVKAGMAEHLEKRAADTTNRIIFLPEIQCSGRSSGGNVYCIDLQKLEAFQTVVLEKNVDGLDDFYFGLFSFARITVQEIYPDSTKSWIIYDKPKKEFTSKKVTYYSTALEDNVVAAGNPIHYFGYVTVEVYS